MTLLLAFGLLVGIAPAALAGTLHIRPELVAESVAPTPGDAVDIAILMTPEPGWHGYWINPGDAGFPLEARWTLPPGARIDPLRYPAPGRLVVAGMMNHVFDRPYALLTRLRLPSAMRAGEPVPIAVTARWLACTDTICVPETATLRLDLVAGGGAVAQTARARFDRWRAALPRPLRTTARYALAGERLSIAIPYPADAPAVEPWFYAARAGAVAHGAAQSVRRTGDAVIFDLTARPGLSGPIEGVAVVAPDLALTLRAVPGRVPTGGEPVGTADLPLSLGAFALALGGALLGGLLLNVMPCVFPILSLKAIALARAGADGREARMEAMAYAAGVILCCLLLGGGLLALRAAGQSVGWAFQLQDSRVIALLLLLAVAMTANLIGLFRVPALAGGRGVAGARGAFLTGMLAAFVATPCTGPFMAAAMGAALVMPWPLAMSIFAGLGLGLSLPFVALAFLPALRRRLPRPGLWMEHLRQIMAVPMGLTALALGWLLWREAGNAGALLALGLSAATVLFAWLTGRAQRRGGARLLPLTAGALSLMAAASLGAILLPRADQAAAAVPDALAFTEAELERLRAQRRPVFLYFTADWCLTCKVNESAAIADPSVRRHFQRTGAVTMEGDWTRGDPSITRFLEANGRFGVPLYLYYAPGSARPRELPQILTPAMLTGLGD